MIALSKNEVIRLHQLIASRFGGGVGLRDEGLLESALKSPFVTFGGDLYPSLVQKAARLCYSLISNHAFVDGNKRIGVLAMMVFLRLNGVKMNFSNDDVASVGLNVASGKWDYAHLCSFVQEHTA